MVYSKNVCNEVFKVLLVNLDLKKKKKGEEKMNRTTMNNHETFILDIV